jgi:beta-ketodecanoyl-[acyl-carrier-protein] synthase
VLGREPEAFENVIILDEFANTATAGSIIAFHQRSHDLAAGDVGLICSFGAGYSVGSVSCASGARPARRPETPSELGIVR